MENFKIKYLTYLLTALIGHAGTANGKLSATTDEDPTDTTVVYLREVNVQSSATPRELNSTASLYSVGNADINRLGITDVSDAIHRLPGVILRDHGGNGSLKTIAVRGLGTQHSGVSYDGATLSDVQSGQIDLSRYSIDNVKNLSLVVGDNQDIFVPARSAASASSLIISSWTPRSLDDPKLKLTALIRGGSFGYISPFLKMEKGNGKNLAFIVSGDYTHADNNYPYTIPNGDDPVHSKRKDANINSGHAEVNMLWKPDIASALNAKIYFYNAFQHLPGPAILYTEGSNETLRDCNMFGQLNYRTRLSRIFSLNVLGKFNWSNVRYKDIAGKYPGGVLNNHYLQREAYGSASLLVLPTRGVSLSYAMDYFFNDLRSNLHTNSHPHRNSILQALSAKYEVWRLTLTAKALLSIYEDSPGNGTESINHTRLSPSAGFSIKPIQNADFFIRLNYKNIFRMPSFNELYFDHYGSISLEPEKTNQFNIGFTYALPSWNWLSECRITIDGYLNTIRNKIVAVPYNMFVWTMTNMGKVRAYGTDVTLSATFPVGNRQKLIFNCNYSYQRAAARTDRNKLDWNKQLPYTPLNSGAFSITWENPWVCIGVHGSGSGARYATTENYPVSRLKAYFDMGFSAYHTFHFHNHELEVRADLINALDTRYEIVNRYPMPGRSWQASVRFTM